MLRNSIAIVQLKMKSLHSCTFNWNM